MNALDAKGRGFLDVRENAAMRTEKTGAAKKLAPQRRVKIASCVRYETFMQELAADYQRLISVGTE